MTFDMGLSAEEGSNRDEPNYPGASYSGKNMAAYRHDQQTCPAVQAIYMLVALRGCHSHRRPIARDLATDDNAW